MLFDVDRLLRLWTDPLPEDDAAAAFREVYSDPVTVNGTPVGADGLVARARALQRVFDGPEWQMLDVVDGGGKVAIAFRLRGRQVGPLTTSAGSLPPTGRVLDLRVIDILTITEGRISDIWMVADELGALVAVDAVRLSPGDGEGDGGNGAMGGSQADRSLPSSVEQLADEELNRESSL
jgi:predicted ester cyclase